MAYYMTIRDRRLMEEALNKGMSIQATARLIGKDPMSVDRELMLRNKDGVYIAEDAQRDSVRDREYRKAGNPCRNRQNARKFRKADLWSFWVAVEDFAIEVYQSHKDQVGEENWQDGDIKRIWINTTRKLYIEYESGAVYKYDLEGNWE